MNLDIINWEKCKNEFIRNVSIDKEKILSILEVVEKREKYIKIQKVDNSNVSFILEGYYEIIKELLTVYLLKNGMRSQNHQCLISFFYKENPEYESKSYLISKLCFLRNRLEYYGEKIDYSFYEQNKDEILKIIKLLKEKISI